MPGERTRWVRGVHQVHGLQVAADRAGGAEGREVMCWFAAGSGKRRMTLCVLRGYSRGAPGEDGGTVHYRVGTTKSPFFFSVGGLHCNLTSCTNCAERIGLPSWHVPT